MKPPGAALLLLVLLASCSREGPPARSAPTDSLFLLGDSLYREEEYDSAASVWNRALTQALQRGDSADQARLLTEIGLAQRNLGNLTAARASLEAALALKGALELGDSSLSRSLNGLGLVARDAGSNQEAIELFERALATARAAGDAAGVARAAGNLGLPLQNLGQLERAREAFQTLLEAGRRLGNARFEANALLNLASLDIWEGNPAPAISRLDSARALYRRIEFSTGEQYALGQLATAYELTGELDRAFAALDSAQALAREMGLLGQEAENFGLIANLHTQVGDWRRAIRYYEQAEALLRGAGFESARGAVLRGAASAYLALGNVRRARADALEALRLHQGSGEMLEHLDDLLLLASIEGSSTPRAAVARLQSARGLSSALNTRGARLNTALAAARLSDRTRDSRRVLEVVTAAQGDLTPGDLWAEWELNALGARARARLGELDSAIVAGRRAVQAVERQRGNLGSGSLHTTLVTERADVYGDLVLALLRQGRSDEAFAVADAARSRGLLEHLASARGRELTPELLRGDELLRRIDLLLKRLRESEPTRPQERSADLASADSVILRELASARNEYEVLLTRVQQSKPAAATVLGVNRVPLDEVRASLARDEALLEYLVTSNRLIIFVVRRDGFRVMERPLDGSALRHRIELLRDLWGRPGTGWQHGLPAARALHASLIQPVAEARLLDDRRKLLIVPHGVLGQLPYAALVNQAGRFLAADYTVSYLPSAGALVALRQREGPPSLGSVGEGLAPFPKELPASVGEVEAFRGARPGAALRLGSQATERALRQALAAGGAVHVATHGTLNVRNPMFSRIELAQDRSHTPDDDGRLEVHELLGLSIRSPLVFFSGCETGAGRAWSDDPVRGTADLSLAQATLAAGAANVISTLWRIEDAGAGVFAKRFYARLREQSVSEALAAAQREMIADPRHASPFYWAGYVLSGEGRFGARPQELTGASVSPSMAVRPVAVRRTFP